MYDMKVEGFLDDDNGFSVTVPVIQNDDGTVTMTLHNRMNPTIVKISERMYEFAKVYKLRGGNVKDTQQESPFSGWIQNK